MNAFHRIFSLIAALCFSVWLIAVIPVSFSYVKRFGVFSAVDTKKTAITVAAVVAFAIFWFLAAVLSKLLFSDWLAARRQRQQTGR